MIMTLKIYQKIVKMMMNY